MFELSEEHRMLQELVAKFIDRDVMPLERAVLAREMSGQKSALTTDEEQTLLGKCREGPSEVHRMVIARRLLQDRR